MGETVCLFERIRRDIRGKIDDGEIKPNEKIPSVNDIKTRYHVSHITALRALKELALDGSVEFVKGRGYFAKEIVSLKKSTRDTGVVACLTRPSRMSTTYDNFFNDVNQAIQRELMRVRFHAIYPFANLGLAELPVLPDELDDVLKEALEIEPKVDGFIIDERVDDNVLEQLMSETRKPVVVVNRGSRLTVDAVIADNVGGAGKAAEIALKMGYERFIAACPGTDSVNANATVRHQAFIASLRERGVGENDIDVLTDYNMVPYEQSIDLIKEKLNGARQKILIFAPNDVFARVVVDTLVRLKYSLGERVGVLGFEGMGYATMREPFVTTFNIHAAEIGRTAARILCARINGDRTSPVKDHVVPCSLQLGESL